MSLSSHKLPIIPHAKVRSVHGFEAPDMIEYDEVVFDYNTNRYLTLSQQRENDALRDEIKKQKEKKKKKLEHIIGYYYKR